MQHETVSLIVPTRNRPASLARALSSLLTNVDNLDEILVIDQSDDSASKDVVTAVGSDKLVYVRCSLRGVSHSLNCGLSRSKGSLLVMTGDDCTVPHDWISRIKDEFCSPSIGAFFGSVKAEPYDWRLGYTPDLAIEQPVDLTRPDPRLIPSVMGANSAFRRRALLEIGGFDTILGTGGPLMSCEDVDAAYRVLRRGYQIALRVDPTVIHFGFRKFENGEWRAALRGGRIGKSAYHVKHIRAGDYRSMMALGMDIADDLRTVLGNLRRRRSPFGLGRILSWFIGITRSMRYRVLRQSRLYYAPGNGTDTGLQGHEHCRAEHLASIVAS